MSHTLKSSSFTVSKSNSNYHINQLLTPPSTGVKREMVVKGEILQVSISAAELRLLRVSIGAVLEHIRLSVDTMDMFDCKDKHP